MDQSARKIVELYRPFRRQMAGSLIFILISQVLGLLGPYLQGKTVDAVIGKSFSSAYWLVAAAFAIYLARVVFLSYWRDVYEIRNLDYGIPEHMNSVTFEKLLSFSLGQHINENSGLKQSVINRGQHSLTSFAYMALYNMLPTIFEVVLMIVALFWISFPMGLVVLSGVCLYLAGIIYINKKVMPELKKLEKEQNENSRFQGEVLRNVELVKVNARERKARGECEENLAGVNGRSKKLWMRFTVYAHARNVVLVLTKLAVGILGVYYVALGRYTPGTLFIFWSWSSSALGSIGSLSYLHRQMLQMWASIKKYFVMLSLESDVVLPQGGGVAPEKFAGGIEFRNVTFSYKKRTDKPSDLPDDDDEEDGKVSVAKENGPARAALQNVSLTINPGERIALVGESGAGKTTFVHALLRAQDPDSGSILVDGVDLRDLNLERFLTSVGVVPQSVPLFDQSIRYNLEYGLNNGYKPTEEELNRVAKMACVDKFFPRLEKGYDTFIGEKGVKLSGGERQRVGIARALLKDPDILVFDEATSNLDAENEALIRDSIEEISKGRTTIIIAHRFSTIRNVDRIYVFDEGRIVGEGTHEDLLSNCEQYQRFARRQLADG